MSLSSDIKNSARFEDSSSDSGSVLLNKTDIDSLTESIVKKGLEQWKTTQIANGYQPTELDTYEHISSSQHISNNLDSSSDENIHATSEISQLLSLLAQKNDISTLQDDDLFGQSFRLNEKQSPDMSSSSSSFSQTDPPFDQNQQTVDFSFSHEGYMEI